MQDTAKWKKLRLNRKDVGTPSSSYLLAESEEAAKRQKEAGSEEELAAFFREKYGIDVHDDFYEGDEHYEEYREAQQAIAEGMSIYGGSIAFEDGTLAELAERIWADMETEESGFRRINTMLEE